MLANIVSFTYAVLNSSHALHRNSFLPIYRPKGMNSLVGWYVLWPVLEPLTYQSMYVVFDLIQFAFPTWSRRYKFITVCRSWLAQVEYSQFCSRYSLDWGQYPKSMERTKDVAWKMRRKTEIKTLSQVCVRGIYSYFAFWVDLTALVTDYQNIKLVY